MIPIYRIRDGFSSLQKNDELMDKIQSLLQSGESVIIFSEGSHAEEDFLRPLKKGMARMIHNILSKNSNENYPLIIPVGIHYRSKFDIPTDVCVSFGKAIDPSNYFIADENPQKFYSKINSVIFDALSNEMVDLGEFEYDKKSQFRQKFLSDNLKADFNQLLHIQQEIFNKNKNVAFDYNQDLSMVYDRNKINKSSIYDVVFSYFFNIIYFT